MHLRTVVPAATEDASGRASGSTLEETQLMAGGIGQRGRRNGVIRPVDGPLPTLVIWLDTDNDSPFTPSADSISLAITPPGSSG